MEFPESNKKECADILGIGKKELFNCFYLAIREKDLKKHVEKGKDLVRISEDSDCYDKILIVWGHPFIAYISVYGAVSIDEEYKFFRIKEKNIENFEVVKFLWPEFRGDRYSLSLKDEVRIDSSELDKRLLKKIFINSGYDKGTYPDGFVHWRSEDIIKEAALSFFTEKEMTIFYEDVKDAKDNNKLKILIMKKLHNQKFFTDIVVNDNESEIIKAEAVTKADITDINILLSIFKKAQYCVLRRNILCIIFESIDTKLNQNFLVSIALDEELHQRERELAVMEMTDIKLLKEMFWYLVSPADHSYSNYYNSLKDTAVNMVSVLASKNNVDEQGFFIEVALDKNVPLDARLSAINNVSHEDILKIIKEGCYETGLRLAAEKKLEK